jgi:hypothetical protein
MKPTVKTTGGPEHPGQEVPAAGEAMHRLAADLYPICRSIIGNGGPRDTSPPPGPYPAHAS